MVIQNYFIQINVVFVIKILILFNYIFILFIIALVVSFILILTNAEKQTHNDNNIVNKKEHKISTITAITYAAICNENVRNMITVLSINGILYYQQLLAQILKNESISTILISFISLFNFTFFNASNNNNNQNGICFINGLTAKGEILIGFILIGMIYYMHGYLLIFIIAYWLIYIHT